MAEYGQQYGSQDPQQGASGATGGVGSTGNYDWNSFASQIPEEYRSNPGKFIEAYRDSSSYKNWYHNEYEPWHKSFDAKSYQEYLQSRHQPQEIDWEDFSAPPTAYERLQQERKAARQEIMQTRQELEQAKQQYLELLHLMRQVDDLRWQERDEFLTSKHGFKPQLDPRGVLEFTMKSGMSDLRTVADLYRQQQAQSRPSQPARQFRDRQAPPSLQALKQEMAKRYPHGI